MQPGLAEQVSIEWFSEVIFFLHDLEAAPDGVYSNRFRLGKKTDFHNVGQTLLVPDFPSGRWILSLGLGSARFMVLSAIPCARTIPSL